MTDTKRCIGCGEELSIEQYRGLRTVIGTAILAARCRDCERLEHLRYQFGITPQQYADMLSLQGGVCAICGGENGTKRLAVDHDHVSGLVRGLLCQRCNTLIGMARDDVGILATAIRYLDKE